MTEILVRPRHWDRENHANNDDGDGVITREDVGKKIYNNRKRRKNIQSQFQFQQSTFGTMLQRKMMAVYIVISAVFIYTGQVLAVTATQTEPNRSVNRNRSAPPNAAAAASSSSSSSGSTNTLRISQKDVNESMHRYEKNKRNQKSFDTMKVHYPSMILDEQDLPIDDQHNKWQSLNANVEFIPADGVPLNVVRRFLEQEEYAGGSAAEKTKSYSRMTGMDSIYDVDPFATGVEEYDEYQQAWRLMGFIIDCNPMVDDDYYANGGSGSGDQGTEDGCARYVLWAAYVDLEYEGGGIGEYQYWNSDNGAWDTSACEYSGSQRCAKMDCHKENTHFSLLGFFKHKSYDDWMEQLFKHEGFCVWNDEEYSFMDSAREAWPQGCIDSYITTSSGGDTEDGSTEIYYDIQPVQGGDIEIGLYTDTQCIKEYKSTGSDDPISVENILGNFIINNGGGSGDNDDYFDFSSDTLEESMSRWNSAFGKFLICQPCVAYDLENYDGTAYNDDDGGNGDGDMFDCYDNADYTNVNQCMKFMAKTTMNTATFRDMSLGRYQGTLAATQMNGVNGSSMNSQNWRREVWSGRLTYLFLIGALGVFIYGGVYFYKAKVATNYKPTFGWVNFKEPLVST